LPAMTATLSLRLILILVVAITLSSSTIDGAAEPDSGKWLRCARSAAEN
jgi:hypothetical protein